MWRLGFRTECLGMATRVWYHHGFLSDLAHRIQSAQFIFVELYMQEWARKLYLSAKSAETEITNHRQNLPKGSDAYALWEDIGTNRRARQPSHLWHESCRPVDYAKVARKLGLAYTEEDFSDPNMGHGLGNPTVSSAFLCIPNTAENYILSLCKRLEPISYDSLTPVTVFGRVLTCVRNPFSRLVSAFVRITTEGAKTMLEACQWEIIRHSSGGDFEKLCEKLPQLVHDERMILFAPQVRHVARLRGDYELTTLRYESLEEELKAFMAQSDVCYGYEPSQKNTNANLQSSCAYDQYYRNSKSVDSVKEAYAADFERFGFSRDPDSAKLEEDIWDERHVDW